MQKQQECVLVSKNTPLLSNLDIVENIALIDEVHHKKSRAQAQKNVLQMLQRLSLEDIAQKRPSACTAEEIFYAMVLRAVLFDASTIIIIGMFHMVDLDHPFATFVQNMRSLHLQKDIIVVDTFLNRTYYEDGE